MRVTTTFQILTNRFPIVLSAIGSIARRLMTAIREAFLLLRDAVNNVDLASNPTTATGADLDRWGQLFDVDRDGATDEDYQDAIASGANRRTLVLGAIAERATAVLGIAATATNIRPAMPIWPFVWGMTFGGLEQVVQVRLVLAAAPTSTELDALEAAMLETILPVVELLVVTERLDEFDLIEGYNLLRRIHAW